MLGRETLQFVLSKSSLMVDEIDTTSSSSSSATAATQGAQSSKLEL
jgi:hypothetical protein